MTDAEDIGPVLDAVERREARFLAWGVVDRSLSRDELEELIEAHTDQTPRSIIRELKRRAAIFEVPRSSPPRYRSRMAEAVRLFAQLRQLFPQRDWTTAAHLVADFRFLVRPRRFPIRNFAPADVQQRLPHLDRTSTAALEALLGVSGSDSERLLSQFQVDASAQILEDLQSDRDRGCIVTAGTGSGKTLSFYLPTLLHLVADRELGTGTAVLAVYPRNELLKDQLRATLSEVRRLRSDTHEHPPIRVGAYYGNTPLQASGHLPAFLNWKMDRAARAAVCPFLNCIAGRGDDECGGRLLWHDEDRRAQREVLVCETCRDEVGPDELALTRRSMQDKPPDILFTTTETLNRQIQDDWSRHVFGAGSRARRSPRLVLLDEVHTYTGTTGAQTAYVLRRWRHLVRGPVAWVGLSATLPDAGQFFAQLTGLPTDRIREIAPELEHTVERGHEYQLLLRGDPASQTALLSTSIQALMLLLRVQDPLGTDRSGGLFGSKVFAFCDNLDVINRLYRQLLDAEGRNPIGAVDGERGGSLALLRSQHHHQADDWDERDAQGQEWWLVDALRESPTPPMIGRTSSQDTGVTAAAETIVATASLEVGYDDPDVGAVLQHKAPRDFAQFLQRRGRAGRQQEHRPWTVVVLSDYGRDRLAYQSYEQLFDPSLTPKSLPLRNRSVQRMQATFAVMDWLAARLAQSNGKRNSVRNDLSGPTNDVGLRTRQLEEASLLRSVLEDKGVRRELETFLTRALQLQSDELDVILWQGPRAVLTEAIPTALRRLESSWQLVSDDGVVEAGDRQRKDHPLPEFTPANLFSDLCLPEVAIDPRDDYDESASTEEPVFLALRELAPGNVTMRYAVRKTKGLWIDPTPAHEIGLLDVTETLLAEGDVIGTGVDGSDQFDIIRPYRIRPDVTPRDVATSSRGDLDWNVRFDPEASSVSGELPASSPWTRVVQSADFFAAAATGGVRALRYAHSGLTEVSRGREGKTRFAYRLTRGPDRVAVGVELDVDAVRMRVDPPRTLDDFDLDSDPRRLRQLVSDRMLHQTIIGLADHPEVNPFLARWLAELTLAGAALDGRRDAPCHWVHADWTSIVIDAFDRSFQGLQADGPSDSPLRIRLDGLLQNEQVRAALLNAFEDATGDRSDWLPWLRDRFATTVGAALHATAQALLPTFDAEDELAVDLLSQPDETIDIWLSDRTVGGGGICEALLTAYTSDPRRFWTIATGALDPSDIESALDSMGDLIGDLADGPLTDLADAYRKAGSSDEALARWRSLMTHIATLGHPPSHPLSVSLSTRLFGPGSSQRSDSVVNQAIQRWRTLEENLGYAVHLHAACPVLARDPDILEALQGAAPAHRENTESWATGLLLQFLWNPGTAVRSTGLQLPRPFGGPPAAPERTLVLDLLADNLPRLDVTDPTWRSAADRALSERGECVLSSPRGEAPHLHEAVVSLMGQPIEVASLYLHPRVVGVRNRADAVEVRLELAEAPQ